MVKVAAPALSLEASGSIGKIMTFSKWKGRPYVRSLVRPANPKSGSQTGVRSMFKFLAQNWTNLSASEKATWETRADQLVVSPFNAFMSYNQFRWRDFLAPSKEDPAAELGTSPTINLTQATAGVRSIQLDLDMTLSATGWGVMIFRSTSTGFSTAFSNLIGVLATPATQIYSWVDTPLDPDTYYYNFRPFTIDGALDPEDGEINATVA